MTGVIPCTFWTKRD